MQRRIVICFISLADANRRPASRPQISALCAILRSAIPSSGHDVVAGPTSTRRRSEALAPLMESRQSISLANQLQPRTRFAMSRSRRRVPITGVSKAPPTSPGRWTARVRCAGACISSSPRPSRAMGCPARARSAIRRAFPRMGNSITARLTSWHGSSGSSPAAAATPADPGPRVVIGRLLNGLILFIFVGAIMRTCFGWP
jgi:hypothetical protein